ncbi:MAG: CDP-alcohol phosphatidyltransferase family protein [Hyphomicrobiaceae bacterium]
MSPSDNKPDEQGAIAFVAPRGRRQFGTRSDFVVTTFEDEPSGREQRSEHGDRSRTGSFAAASRSEGHERELNGFISRYEKPILESMARQVPDVLSPDHMTAIGVAGAGITFLGLTFSNMGAGWLLLAAAGLGINWLGDSLDGTLARVRGIERPRYGFFIDHMTDVGAQSLVVLGMGLSPYLRLDLAMMILVVYLAMTIFTLMKLHVDKKLCLSFGGVGPTELRVFLLIAIALALYLGPDIKVETSFGSAGLYDFLAVLFVAATSVMMFVIARDQARELALQDPRVKMQVMQPGRLNVMKNGARRPTHIVLAVADGRTLLPIGPDGSSTLATDMSKIKSL